MACNQAPPPGCEGVVLVCRAVASDVVLLMRACQLALTRRTLFQVFAAVHERCATLVAHACANHHIPPRTVCRGLLQHKRITPACRAAAAAQAPRHKATSEEDSAATVSSSTACAQDSPTSWLLLQRADHALSSNDLGHVGGWMTPHL